MITRAPSPKLEEAPVFSLTDSKNFEHVLQDRSTSSTSSYENLTNMESSPLTQAHIHARNAVSETRKSNPVAASEEHDLAAGEFAHAAQISGDPEALRTLKLLEEHHKKLAQILKFRNEHPPIPEPTTDAVVSPSPTAGPPPPANSTSSTATPGAIEPSQQPPRLPPQNRIPHRDLSSSIASNLASARGIPPNQQRRAAPGSPTLPAQRAGGKGPRGLPVEYKSRKDDNSGATGDTAGQGSASKANIPPPVLSHRREPASSPAPRPPAQDQPSVNEERFQRFYSTFEGIISKLSAPLAFASLPLSGQVTSDSSQQMRSDAKPKPSPAISQAPTQDPDLNKLISRAALRAVKDSNSPGSFGYNAAESFYVVPTTGGTVSYAGILSRAEQESLRQKHINKRDDDPPTPFLKELSSNSDDEGDADFVDARETPMNQSPESRKPHHGRSKTGVATVGGQTMEELHMQNQYLKQLSDTLSKRLHMWEANAQSSGAALHQSLRLLQNSPRSTPVDTQQEVADNTSDEATLKKLYDLEEMIKKAELERERTIKENEKLKTVVNRYRDRWEKLKEGARVRREGASPANVPPEKAPDNAQEEEG